MVFHHVVRFAVSRIRSEQRRMIIGIDDKGEIIRSRETHVSKDEIIDLSIKGNVNTLNARDGTAGKVESKLFFGKPLLPSVFPGGNK